MRLVSRFAAFVALGVAIFACSFTDLNGFSTEKSATGNDGGDALSNADAGSRPPAEAGTDGGPEVPAYVASVLADKPLAYFRFEEDASANTAKDEISGRIATPNKQVAFGSAGAVGHGVAFSGEEELSLGDVFDFAGQVPFTFEFWINAQATGGDQQILSKRREDPSQGDFVGYVVYVASDGTVHFEYWGIDLSAWSDKPLANEHTHVALVITYANGKGNAKLWINAQPAAAGGFDNTTNGVARTTPLVIGRGLHGSIDELAIYDAPLSPDRILAHYKAR